MPVWIGYYINENILNDATDFFQLGNPSEKKFYSGSDSLYSDSTSWNIFPTEDNPLARYKYASLQFTFEKDLTVIDRSTRSFFDLLGDCGGFLKALYYIAQFLITPFTSYALNQKLISMIALFRTSDKAKFLQRFTK